MKKFDRRQDYSDLLEQENDEVSRALINDLHTAYTHPVPPLWLNWRTTKARYQEETLTKSATVLPRRFAPAHRFPLSLGSAIALMLVFVTLASAATFAISPQVREVLGLTLGNQSSLDSSDYTSLHQTRTIGGVEITLEAVYADQVEIKVGFSIHSTSKDTPTVDVPQLRTKQGQKLPGYLGGFAGDMAQAWSYDATSITGNPKQLDLLLDVTVGHEKETFAFSTPFHPGKVITFHNLRATSNGATVTLERVVYARSGAVFFTNGYTERRGILPSGTLSGPGKRSYSITAFVEFKRLVFAQEIPLDKGGDWTLTIKEDIPKGDPNTPKDARPGTLTFHFQIS